MEAPAPQSNVSASPSSINTTTTTVTTSSGFIESNGAAMRSGSLLAAVFVAGVALLM